MLDAVLFGVLRPELSMLQRTSLEHARALSLAAELRDAAADARRSLAAGPPDGAGGPARLQPSLQARERSWEETTHLLESLATSTPERLAVARLRSAVTASAYRTQGLAAAAEHGVPRGAEALAPLLDDLARTVDAAGEIVLVNARQVRNLTRTEGASLTWLLAAGFVITAVTIAAALVLLRRALRQASRQAAHIREHAAEMSIFAARAAHDLRSPLQALSLSLQLARVHGRADVLERAEASVRRMNETIRDLLEFSAAGRGPGPQGSARVEEVLAHVMEDLAIEEQQELALERAVQPGLEVGMVAGQLRTVLMNLVGNAAKYAAGRPQARVEVRARGEGRQVRIEVADNGPGIDPEALPYVFDPYFRASAQPGGYGLGLATVKRLVEACGGEVAVASEPGRGSTFTLGLPRPPAGREP